MLATRLFHAMLLSYLEWLQHFCSEDETKSDSELVRLADHFREQASMLVDMLDISIPTVAKLKVCKLLLF